MRSFVAAKPPSTSSNVPKRVEKNTTYAQMSKVLKVAFFIAVGNIPTSKWIFAGNIAALEYQAVFFDGKYEYLICCII